MAPTSEMWISSLEVSGLAGSDKTIKYNLNKDINVFYGLNGSGKTSLLKIIHAAGTNTTHNLSSVPFKSAKFNFNYYGTFLLERSIINTGTKQSIEKSADGLAAMSGLLIPTSSSEAPPLEWESSMYLFDGENRTPYTKGKDTNYILPHKYLPISRVYLALESQVTWEKRQFTEQELEESFAKLITERWKDYSYQVSNSIKNAQAKGLASILKDVWSTTQEPMTRSDIDLEQAYMRVSSFLHRQNIQDILQSFDDFKTRVQGGTYLWSIIKDINDVEETIEKAIIPKSKLEEIVIRLFGGNVKLKFDENKIAAETREGNEISLGALSSGQKQLLTILLDALLAADSPILIDEPEISMHVDWQSELVRVLRELAPSSQIIMATHSPEIAGSVSDDKLFCL